MDRRRDLDGLRGIAVLLTIIFHYVARSGFFPYLGPQPVTYLLWSTWAGVDIFFVLSGFLIGGIVLDHGRTANFFRVFYLRRSLRILPVALLTIAFCYLILPLLQPGITAEATVPPYAYLLFINNFWTANNATEYVPLGPFWSLAIEEQFYLIAPVLLLLASPRVRIAGLIGIVALSPFLRMCDFGVSSWDFTPLRLDGLAAGLLLASLVRTERATQFVLQHLRHLKIVLLCLTAAAVLFAMTPRFSNIERSAYGVSLNSLTAAAAILYLYFNRTSSLARTLSRPWLVTCGQLSYFLYLMHMPVALAVLALLHTNAVTVLIVSLVVCFGMAWLSWRFLESRLIGFGKRFAYRTPDSGAVSSLREQPAASLDRGAFHDISSEASARRGGYHGDHSADSGRA